MSKLFLIVLAVLAFIGMLFGIDWLLWKAWLWALPQLWPTGPEGLIRPGFWLFVISWFLLGCLGGTLFKSSSSK